ncbi:MAG: N-formylglutamate deformylase [Rhodospirillales bacterium]|nr:N-formylglutamate deformylase [Rhodospirillales bacterium]
MDIFDFIPGTTPLLISAPHPGTHIPEDIKPRMTDEGLLVADTDWHIPILYDFAPAMGAHFLSATHSRYCVDLNRPPENVNLYPGQDTEGLLPLKTGKSEPVYKEGQEPDDAEIETRRNLYHTPYHAKLAETLAAIKSEHGYALLWDAHSIKSELPRFFEGKLWDINLGTNNGESCDPRLQKDLEAVAGEAAGYTWKMNGRYIGGYITRHYGDPENNIHAVQLELSWATYMDEFYPFNYRDDLAAGIRPVLQRFIQTMLNFRP